MDMEQITQQQKQENQQNQENGGDDDDKYISQLSLFELSAYRIAKSHLGTSFNLKKSNGYLKWIGKK
jgi:hypothetical protein